MHKKDKTYFRNLGLTLIWCIVSVFNFPFKVVAQDEDEKPIYTGWEDGPIFVSFGPNLSKVYGREFPIGFDFKQSFEGGILIKYAIADMFPVYFGVEYQRRGYAYNRIKTGTTQNGKYYEDQVKGRVLLSYLSFPLLFELPAEKQKNKFHFIAGVSTGLRIYYNEKYDASRTFPKDSLTILTSYVKTGNDALDFLEFNLCLGAKYRILPRMEIMALASLKGFGLSISKENFITSKELHNVFSFKLLYRITSIESLPIFY